MTTPARVGRATNYLDPPGFAEELVNFDDPLECAAIAYHRLTFEVAAEVAAQLDGGPTRRPSLAYTWARLDEAARQRFRRMADTVVDAHAGPAERAAHAVPDDVGPDLAAHLHGSGADDDLVESLPPS